MLRWPIPALIIALLAPAFADGLCNPPFSLTGFCVAVTCHRMKCVTELSVELVGGSASHGLLRVTWGHYTGTVCANLFDDDAAGIVCRKLGFGDGVVRLGEFQTDAASLLPVLDNVQCEGHEASLSQCSHAIWGVTSCSASDTVSISCDPAVAVRIVSDSSSDYSSGAVVQVGATFSGCVTCSTVLHAMGLSLSGLVEVFHSIDRVWSPVCASTFGLEEAKVMSRGRGPNHRVRWCVRLLCWLIVPYRWCAVSWGCPTATNCPQRCTHEIRQ
jgi:hypothetical protein